MKLSIHGADLDRREGKDRLLINLKDDAGFFGADAALVVFLRGEDTLFEKKKAALEFAEKLVDRFNAGEELVAIASEYAAAVKESMAANSRVLDLRAKMGARMGLTNL